MAPKNPSLYRAHVERLEKTWGEALEAEGYGRVLVHSGSPIYAFLDDYAYPFRPNPHFLAWLPLTHHADSVLVYEPGRKPVLYYHQPEDYWHLPPADPEAWWADAFEVRPVAETDAWTEALGGADSVLLGDAPALREAAGARAVNPGRLVNQLHLLRTRKSAWEIECMAEANVTAARAHRAAERAFREGASELEIHQRYLEAAGQTDDELPYGNIVALNEHGAVLHYQHRDAVAPRESRSFLIDAGANCFRYAADITRTWTTQAGAFADLIEAMNAAQQRLCAKAVADRDYRELHLEAHREIATILRDAGVIRVAPEDAVESGLSAVFFPHGLGHFIGLQTHDVAGLIADADGTPIPRPEGHPFLRLTRRLEPGNVVTIEPGLYFIDALLAAWRRDGDADAVAWDVVDSLAPFGGIRIEDDVAVKADGEPRNLSREAFASLDG